MIAVDVEGTQIEKSQTNPILDSRLYKVEFIDGNTETLSANVIAENILEQMDIEGIRKLNIDVIVDHHCE